MADNAKDLQRLMNWMTAFSLQCELSAKTNKTEVMISTKSGILLAEISTYNNKFVYLGIVFVYSAVFTPT